MNNVEDESPLDPYSGFFNLWQECNEKLISKEKVEWQESEDRYYDVMPYADNCFKSEKYYANASPIKINKAFEFIASQGPMEGTIESFLDLIKD